MGRKDPSVRPDRDRLPVRCLWRWIRLAAHPWILDGSVGTGVVGTKFQMDAAAHQTLDEKNRARAPGSTRIYIKPVAAIGSATNLSGGG